MRRGHKFFYSGSDRQRAGIKQQNTPATQNNANKKLTGSGVQGTALRDDLLQAPPFQGRSSPRKRKRSPVSDTAPKMLRVGDFDDDEGDELDALGIVALEQYDLTQREGSTSPNQIPIPQKPIPKPLSTGLSQKPIPKSHSTGLSQKPIPKSHSIAAEDGKLALKVVETPSATRNKPSCFSQPNVFPRSDQRRSFYGSNSKQQPPPKAAGPSSSSSGSDGELEERIKHLQEQNYSKDGEVKVLRGEKERLLGELRKKDEQMRQIQATLLAEKQAREKQLVKERDTLATELQFKEQEVVTLREKWEQRVSNSQGGGTRSSSSVVNPGRDISPRGTTPVPTRSKGHSRTSTQDGKQTEFVSTETFMPLSQLSAKDGGGITPVHVGPRNANAEGSHGRRSGRGDQNKATRSRSISPNPSALKKMRKRSVSDKGDATSVVREEGSASTTSGCRPISMGLPEGGNKASQESSTVLYVPGRELDGVQTLLLLVKQNLLKPPSLSKDFERPLQNTSLGADRETPPNVHGDASKMKGLLSLLHTEPRALTSFPSVAAHSTPASERYDESVLFQRQSSDSDSSSCVSTPTRHTRPLSAAKSHSLARTSLAQLRVRRNSGLLHATKTSSSTANTPIKAPLSSESTSSSLLSSINAHSIHKNIASLLSSFEMSRYSSSSPSLAKQEKGFVPASCFRLGGSSHSHIDPIMEILQQVGSLVTSYYREQLAKTSSLSSNSHLSSESSEASLLLSPKSSSTGSKTGSDPSSPLPADQQLVTQALEILEVLAAYSRVVREQVLLQPLQFVIDSRPSSSLDIHQGSPLNLTPSDAGAGGVRMEGGAEVGVVGRGKREVAKVPNLAVMLQRMTPLGKLDSPIAETELIAKWKKMNLSHVKKSALSLSDRVWFEHVNGATASSRLSWRDMCPPAPPPSPSIKGSACGNLFSVLLDLPVPSWKESQENTICCFRILTTLAEDCPVDSLSRFGQLFRKETISICLEKEDPHLTSSVLHLLALLVRAEDVVRILCGHGGDPCVLLLCYQCLLDPPSSAGKEMVCKIQLQIVRLISRIATSATGPQALYERPCCSHELLGFLVSLLEKMVDGVYQANQWSHRE